MQSSSITVTSVSCPTGVNNDCGILTLMQFLGNHGIIKTYDNIVSFVKARMAEFGLSYDPQKEQMGEDLFEAALLEFMPEHQIELYKLIWRDQRREVSLEIINAKRGRIKSQYRLILISSWDHKHNTVGAGHYALLNTRLATTAQIINTLTNVGYTEDRFAMQTELSCTFCNSELIASNARICGNRPECQTLYCNDQCAQRDWDQHYAQCSTLKLIQSGRGPETTEEEAKRLRRKLAKLREKAAREEAEAAERERAANEEAAREAAERQRAAREEAERERAANEEVLSSLRELETLHEERLALAKREAKLKDTLKKAQTEAARRRQLHKAKMKQDWPDNMVIEDE